MNESFARALCQLNNRFYQEQAASFSNTRQTAWPGWERCLEHIAARLAPNAPVEQGAERPFSILDVACGNLRFEEFLACSLPQDSFVVTALDACDDLLPEEPLPNVRYQHCDIIDVLLGGTLSSTLRQEPRSSGSTAAALASTSPVSTITSPAPTSSVPASPTSTALASAAASSAPDSSVLASPESTSAESASAALASSAPTSSVPASPESTSATLVPEHHLYDCVVSFGFMHHVPGTQWRERFLSALIDAAEPGGLICLSLWRFMDNEALAEKAHRTHHDGTQELSLDAAQFEPGDYLIGWKNKPGAYRYCHSFTDSEVDDLLASMGGKAEYLARFRADGRTEDLNEYLILCKKDWSL